MAIIYTYPEINQVEGEDLLLISDTSLYKRPTRSVTVDDLAAYIGTVVGVVQNLQSVLTVGNTYVSPDGYGTFTLNDLANKNGSIKYSNTDEGWGYALNAEEGLNFTDGNGGFDNGKSSFAPYAVWIGNGTHQAQISSNNLTASRIFQLPNASGTIALTSDIPAPGPSGSGTTNYTARWTNASTLGIGALYDNGNYVGIGTNNPTNKLHVYNGITRLDSGSASSNALGVYSNFSNTAINLFANSGSGFISVSSSGMDLGAPWNGGAKVSILNNGNVGIGATSPSEKLEVAGNILVNGSNDSADGLHLKDRTFVAFSDASSVVSRFRSSASGIFQFQDGSYNTNIVLNNNGNSYLNGGNVGIGTTSPSTKLHIQGAASGYLFRVQGTSTLNVYDPGAAAEIGVGSGSGDKLKLFSNDSLNNGITIDTSGNVGIGTTSPSQKLEVSGNSLVTGTQFIGDTFTKIQQASGNLLLTNQSSSGAITFLTNSSEKLRVTSNGNVGIGTTAPTTKLQVNGDVRIYDENELYFGGIGSVPNWEVKASGSDLIINDTGTNVGSVLFNNDEGIVLPRLTTTEINAISLPNTGLTVYNTTLNTLCFYNGSSWQKVSHTNM